MKTTKVIEPCFLLSKQGILTEDRTFFLFLLQCLRSTWTMVRLSAYEILVRYPIGFQMLKDEKFINEILLTHALSMCNNAKAMMAEGAALTLKLIFSRCLDVVYPDEPSTLKR